MDGADLLWLPVERSWRLNERHYGALQGKDKAATLDTYGEGYHFAALHKQTLAPYFRNDITIYDRFGPHHRVLFVARDMEQWLDKPEEDWGVDHALGGIHYIFPNTLLFAGGVSPGKGYYTTFRHFPGEAPGETTTYKTIYAPGGVTSDAHRQEVS